MSQNCTNSPSVSPTAVGANNVAEAWMPKQRQSNQGRVSLSDELTSAKQDVEPGQSHMDVILSV
ncbi:hypothetical protein GCM10007107_21380 [Shewanella indica]|nr:hypothetical protein GCM10007107_21380 [Shewanella indica]